MLPPPLPPLLDALLLALELELEELFVADDDDDDDEYDVDDIDIDMEDDMIACVDKISDEKREERNVKIQKMNADSADFIKKFAVYVCSSASLKNVCD